MNAAGSMYMLWGRECVRVCETLIMICSFDDAIVVKKGRGADERLRGWTVFPSSKREFVCLRELFIACLSSQCFLFVVCSVFS